jgi:hypothetical protein
MSTIRIGPLELHVRLKSMMIAKANPVTGGYKMPLYVWPLTPRAPIREFLQSKDRSNPGAGSTNSVKLSRPPSMICLQAIPTRKHHRCAATIFRG